MSYGRKGKGKRSGSGYKGKGSNRNPHRDNVPDSVPDGRSNRVNDPAWYMKTNGVDSALAGKLGFVSTLGNPIPIDHENGAAVTFGTASFKPGTVSVPGICTMNLTHTLGTSDDPQDTVNVCATKMYGSLREKMTNTFSFSKSALMLEQLAVSDLFAFYAFGVRAWAYSNKITEFNRYTSACLTEACGFNWADLLGKREQLKTYLNLFAERAKVLHVPSSLSYFQRRFMLYQNVFQDEKSERAQLYLYRPDYFFKLGRDTTGNMVLEKEIVPPSLTVAGYMLLGEALLDALINDDDVANINGCIMKCFDQYFVLPTYPNELIPEFVYDEYILGQIQNSSTVTSVYWADASGTPRQEIATIQLTGSFEDRIDTHPIFYHGTPPANYKEWLPAYGLVKAGRILNTNTPVPDPGEVYDMTRFTIGSCEAVESNGAFYIKPHTVPTEIVSQITVYFRMPDGSWYSTYIPKIFGMPTSGSINNALATDIASIAKLSNFRKHPAILYYSINTTAGTANLQAVFTDMDNYTVVDGNRMDDINRTAMQSLFLI